MTTTNGSAAALVAHPLANRLPLMEAEEFEHFVDDIARNGQREPIVIHEGKILDGRNRYRACEALGRHPKTRTFDPKTEGSPDAFVISVNLKRRHLTAKQKQEFILELLKANPAASNRSIARDVGVSDKTVGVARDEMQNGFERFKLAWRKLGPAHQREFAITHRADLQQFLGA
jgi:hypothetical protein